MGKNFKDLCRTVKELLKLIKTIIVIPYGMTKCVKFEKSCAGRLEYF